MELPHDLATLSISGGTFHFDMLFGRVAAERKWSETRVWGSGGGGRIGRRGGTLDPVRIQSASDLNQEIWLELPGGAPYCLPVMNMNVQALEGHPLTVVLIRPEREKEPRIGLVCNLATGMVFDDPELSRYLAKTYTSTTMAGLFFTVLALAGVVGTMYSGLYLLGAILLIPALALAGRIAKSFLEGKAQTIRLRMQKVNEWALEQATLNARAADATVIYGAQVSSRTGVQV